MPMDDFEYLEGHTGNGIDLSRCNKANDGMTGFLDGMWGPDKTDAFDSSCNTCKHFQRTPFDRKERVTSVFGFPGTCGKTGQSVTGWPRGQFCGHSCYENRRTGQSGPIANFHTPH